jgi:hypothetical protein
MYRIRRQALENFLPLLLLVASFCVVYFGLAPVWLLRDAPLGPQVPLVSVPQGTTSDVWSSLPGLLHIWLAALLGILFIEVARLLWIATGVMTVARFVSTLLYELSIVVDMFRLWGRDWLVWAKYELRLGQLCDPVEACFPVSGAIPWFSLLTLLLVMIVSLRSWSR